MLHALPPTRHKLIFRFRLLQEHLHRRGLADAGLPRHKDKTALTTEGAVKQGVQALQDLVPPHDGGAPGRPLHRGVCRYRSDKPISPLDTGNKLRGTRVILEHGTKVTDVAFDRPAIDHLGRPHCPTNLRLREGLLAVGEQDRQHFRRRASQRYICPFTCQPPTVEVKAKRAKVEGRFWLHRTRRRTLPLHYAQIPPLLAKIPPNSTA